VTSTRDVIVVGAGVNRVLCCRLEVRTTRSRSSLSSYGEHGSRQSRSTPPVATAATPRSIHKPGAWHTAPHVAPVTELHYEGGTCFAMNVESADALPTFAAETADVTGLDVGYGRAATR